MNINWQYKIKLILAGVASIGAIGFLGYRLFYRPPAKPLKVPKIVIRKGIHKKIKYEGMDFYTAIREENGILYDMRFVEQSRKTFAASSVPYNGICRFNQYLNDRGIQAIFVPVPMNHFIYDFEEVESSISRTYDAICKSLQDSGIQIIDLKQDMKDFLASGRAPFLRTDSHWSPEYAEHAAEIIFEQIKKEHWFRQGSGTISLIKKSKRYLGDFTRRNMEFIPLLRGEKEEYNTNQVLLNERAPGIDSSSPILFIGDSFAKMFSRARFRESGSIAAHLAGKIKAEINDSSIYGSLPNRWARQIKQFPDAKCIIFVFSSRKFFIDYPWNGLEGILGR